ncbi:uncharacterized protein LOC135129477 [Zophobas morio]|uniref:uncharacterized protein LOC135129477 n=1 Tax=Zophobas morio TaxID=2755281 RepID=UPI0030833E4F
MDKKDSSKRSANFSKEDESLLIDIIAENKDVIENKQSGAQHWKDKEKAWEKVTDLFNANSTSGARSTKTLRDKYNNLKKKTKEKNSKIILSFRKTGGGDSEEKELNPVEAKVKQLMGVQVEGLPSSYDCDNEIVHNPPSIEEYVMAEYEQIVPGPSGSNRQEGVEEIETDWTAYCPKKTLSTNFQKIKGEK